MAWHSFLNISTILLVFMFILPAQLNAYYTQNTGCHHNGTWYADKSLVPTTEKCLNCQCNKKTLVCRLKVCPEMPMPPPRGCVVVEKKNTCCPYLSCARLDAFYAKIPATRRIIAYLDHYERESIDRVVNENMLQRRSDDTDVDLYVCVKNGTVYKSGSAMSSSNLCSYCYCIGGTEKCVKPKCMLPVGGCKPIFVDSTCCPVRYDCSVKQTGKSSQEQRYRKTSNKHYLRMSQRLQRNRGCQMGQQFYVEGQKMKSDPDKPCDVCFCIRGQRKCAPKKCSPSLRNCIPVVPKGQCCPSSYDCGSQRDYRRAQNSRQFNLYSLLFGKDEEGQEDNAATEISVEYPHDREPLGSMQSATAALQHNNHGVMSPSTEKSIFDTIREGLEFIDSNNAPVLNNNLDLGSPKPSPKPIPLMAYNYMVPEHSTTTEVSFLDLLLGPTDNSTKTAETNKDETTSAEEPEEKTTNTAISWVDLILGPDEEDLKASASDTISDKLDAGTSTLVQDHTDFTTTIDRMDNEVAESQHTLGELTAYDQEKLFTSTHDDEEQTTEAITTEDTTLPTTMADTTDAMSSTQKQETTERTTEPTKKPTSKPEKLTGSTKSKPQKTTKQPNSIHSTQASNPTNSTSTKPTKKTSDFKPLPDVKKVQKTENLILKETKSPNKTMNASKPANNSDFLAALIDGLSDILNKEQTAQNGTAQINQTVEKIKTATLKLPTPKPLPLFKPLPVDKTYTRINSKIANLTLKQTVISNNKEHVNKTFRPMPPLVHPKIPIIPIKEDLVTSTVYNEPKSNQTLAAAASTASTAAATTSHATTSARSSTGLDSIEVAHSSTTLKPVVIESNPSILEAEPIEAEPTLPPSLPNLKIIPFLPTDALNAEPSSSYDYYHHPHVTGPISRIDYDIYDDDANVYPSITEKYPMYPDMEDASKAEYIYKFNIEGPDSVVPGTAGKFDESFNMKYDFPAASMRQVPKGFSPPTKTEGGFVPKEPLHLDADNVDRLGEDGSEEEIRPSGSSQVASVAGVASVTNVAVGSVAEADHDVSVKVGDSYQVTQHIIEITTPADVMNTTKLIEITTPDPFKNVIRTEPPPDLTSLIEDKLKNKLIASMDATLAPASEAAQAKYSEHGAAGAALPATMEINVTSLISKESNLQLEDIETKEIVKSNVDDKNLEKIIKKTETLTHVADHQNHDEDDDDDDDVEKLSANIDDDDDDDDDADAIDNNEQIDLGNNKQKAGTEADHNQSMNITNDMINATIPPFKTLPAAIMKHFDKETATTVITETNIRETSTPATTKSFNRPTTFTRTTTTTTPLNATINGSGNTKYASKYKPIQNHNIKNKPNFVAQSSSSTTTSSQLALTTFSAKNRTLPKTYARTTVKPTRNRVVISTTPRIKLQYKPKKNSTRTVNSPVSALKSTSASSLSSSSQVATSTTSPATSASAVNLKLKYNANRRLPSPKPGKYNKATNRPITTTTTTTTATVSDISPITTATATTRKNILKAAKPINIEISSEASEEQEEDESEQEEDDEEEEEQHTTMTTTTTTTIKTTKAPTTTSTTTTRTTLTTPSTTASQEPLRHQQHQQQQQQHQQSTTQNPFLMSPFDKLPFMNASFEVKRNSATQSSQSEPTIQWPSSSSDSMTQPQYFDGHQYHPQHNIGTNGLMQYTHMVNQFNGLSEETSRQPIELSTSASATTSSTSSAASSSSSSSTATQSTNLVQTSPSTSTFSTTSSNNLMDPIGLLKLAGCNIYGRMYRVGRIILELSSPCLECKCTEIGVKCGPLEC